MLLPGETGLLEHQGGDGMRAGHTEWARGRRGRAKIWRKKSKRHA